MNYRETITKKVPFNYLHKKQTGGSGQFARVMGFIEPIPEDTRDDNNELVQFEFQNRVVGANIPPEYISSVEKGEYRALSEMCVGHGPESNAAGDVEMVALLSIRVWQNCYRSGWTARVVTPHMAKLPVNVMDVRAEVLLLYPCLEPVTFCRNCGEGLLHRQCYIPAVTHPTVWRAPTL